MYLQNIFWIGKKQKDWLDFKFYPKKCISRISHYRFIFDEDAVEVFEAA